MRWGTLLLGMAFMLTCGFAHADDDDAVTAASWFRLRSNSPSYSYPCPPNPYYPPGTLPSITPDPANPNNPPVQPNNPQNPDLTNPFASAAAGGGLQGRSFNETFDGDFGGVYYSKTIVVGFNTVKVQTGTKTIIFPPNDSTGIRKVEHIPIFSNVTTPITRAIHIPVAGAYSGVLITDNDSPRPVDRVYFDYNYYSSMGSSFNAGNGINENREMFGFEKTFLNGNASFGMRLPFIELNGPNSTGGNSVGDLSVLFKYAFINDPKGNVFASGLIVTAPTSRLSGELSDGSSVPNSVLFQPWTGFVKTFDRAYVEGITDLIVPTDIRDTVLWTNSLAAGYWVYQNPDSKWLNGIIPTAEVHVHTPLNNRSLEGLVYVPNEVNITGGLHLRLPRATLTGAVSVPLVGPHPYSLETLVNLNFWF
jgi:hypothetical protein